jgi:hypothetical protein
MRPFSRESHDKEWQLRDVLGIGVGTRTPKVDQELQQNHNETHNARPLDLDQCDVVSLGTLSPGVGPLRSASD